MRAVFQSLLMIAVTFVYVAGPFMTFQMEHAHEVCGSHDHHHPGDDHSHHPHDEGSIPSSEAPDSDGPEGDSRSHTHVVSMGMGDPFTPASHKAFMASRIGDFHPVAVSEFVPEGPSFSLIKPPQLG